MAASAFPNGRPGEAAVVVLNVELFDVFVDVDGDATPGPSFNPMANDVPFEPSLSFLAPAHE